MRLAPRIILVGVALSFALPLRAQDAPASATKTTDSSKAADTKAAGVTKMGAVDKLPAPPGGVIVVVDELKEALSFIPKMVLMTPEEYQKLLDRAMTAEKQKTERKTVHACKLSGHMEGDFLVAHAAYLFATDSPKSTVFLGLQGAFLTDEGKLDDEAPPLEVADDGYQVRVEKSGAHMLLLNFRVPVVVKRTTTAGGGERSFELGLPGAAVATLALDLPTAVKEVRWNDLNEKPRTSGHWELALGKIKTLTVSWKEPTAATGNIPLLAADSRISAKVDDAQVVLEAEMTLEDLRAQTKEWQLVLPANSRVEVKGPAGLVIDVLNPINNRPQHRIRLAEATAERLQVHVEARFPRPLANSHLPIGPFYVLGAYRQQGMITVYAPKEALSGDQLLLHRTGEVFAREIPKGATDVAAIYKYWNLPVPFRVGKAPGSKAPLDLELTPSKLPGEGSVEHLIQVRPSERLVEVTTTILMKSRRDSVDLRLPTRPRPSLGFLGFASGLPFPAAMGWPFVELSRPSSGDAMALDFVAGADGFKLSAADANGKAKLLWSRASGAEAKIIGRYVIPPGATRARVELPRPTGLRQTGAKIKVRAPEQSEITASAAGASGPVRDRQEASLVLDAFPELVDLSWTPYRSDFVVRGVADVWFYGRSAEVKQNLQFNTPERLGGASPPEPIRLHVPGQVRDLTVASGGKLVALDLARQTAWLAPLAEAGARADIDVHYAFSVPNADSSPDAPIRVAVPVVWPEQTSRDDVKVRAWSESGVSLSLANESDKESVWIDKGTEIVPGQDALPALVAHASDANSPLELSLAQPNPKQLSALLCARALIQAAIDDDGDQLYRARYVLTRVNVDHVELEFPVFVSDCIINVWLDRKRLTNWQPLDRLPKVARIPVSPKLARQPVLLEIEYKLPGPLTSARWWRTDLQAPRFAMDAFSAGVRWQVSTPPSQVAIALDGKLDYRWGFQGWLLGPEPAISSGELEAWLMDRDVAEQAGSAGMTLIVSAGEPVRLLHVPRLLWLVLCSGALVLGAVALTLLSLPREWVWLIVLIAGFGLFVVSLVSPGFLPPLLLGCQPGALVVLILAVLQWMLQEGYRRRLLFMPGFSRSSSNSSLHRVSGKYAEPSTIDAPAAAAVSHSSVHSSGSKGT